MSPAPASDAAALGAGVQACVGLDGPMARLRQQAWGLAEGTDWSRRDDHDVVAALQARPWPDPVSAPQPLFRLVLRAGNAAPPPSAAAAPAAPRAAAAAPAPPDPAADASFSADIDAAAMAQALQAAARDGVPFCEECERARQAAVAAA